MNTEILKKINAEWLLEKTLPSLVRRDAPEIALEQSSDDAPRNDRKGRNSKVSEPLLFSPEQ